MNTKTNDPIWDSRNSDEPTAQQATPRTDKALEDRHEPPSGLVWSDFARQLERELAEALKWKEEDPRMLREQIRVADESMQFYVRENNKLRAENTELQKDRERLDFWQEHPQQGEISTTDGATGVKCYVIASPLPLRDALDVWRTSK